MTNRVQENRVRRKAKRRGYIVWKSRRRDPLATDYGAWSLARADAPGALLIDPNQRPTLDDVEAYLQGDQMNPTQIGMNRAHEELATVKDARRDLRRAREKLAGISSAQEETRLLDEVSGRLRRVRRKASRRVRRIREGK